MITDLNSYENKFSVLSELVKEHLETAPGCHDFEHVSRVFHNARLILQKESAASLEIVELAAILHDIARPEEMKSNGKICHAVLGAEMCFEFLKESGFHDESVNKQVSECIKKHRYRGTNKPETINEKIVYDADKLDSIGAVGIGRAFHFAGRIGAKLHNTEEDARKSEAYSREDTAYREYLVKLKNVPSRMLTTEGCRIAKSRAELMTYFFKTLNIEVYGNMESVFIADNN